MTESTIGQAHDEGPELGSPRLDFRLGEWTVRPSLDQIERDGVVVHLQHLSMRVLCYLVERKGAVVGYDELLDALWPGRVVAEDAVHRRIADLRQQLGDDARSPRYIETIVKQGYRVIATAEPHVAVPHPRRWILTGAVLLTVTAVILLGVVPRPNPPAGIIRAAQAALAEEDYDRTHDIIAEFLESHPEHPDVRSIADALLLTYAWKPLRFRRGSRSVVTETRTLRGGSSAKRHCSSVCPGGPGR